MEFITVANTKNVKLIEDILLHPLKSNSDKTGVLVETLRTDWRGIYGKGKKFAMQYYSITKSGLARDENMWHYHPNQEDRFIVVQGGIVTAIADYRKDSPTFGLLNLFYVQSQIDPFILLIPNKTLHGFMVVSTQPAILLNFPTSLYNPKEERRLPHNKAQVKFSDGSLFSWEKVRKQFLESIS